MSCPEKKLMTVMKRKSKSLSTTCIQKMLKTSMIRMLKSRLRLQKLPQRLAPLHRRAFLTAMFLVAPRSSVHLGVFSKSAQQQLLPSKTSTLRSTAKIKKVPLTSKSNSSCETTRSCKIHLSSYHHHRILSKLRRQKWWKSQRQRPSCDHHVNRRPNLSSAKRLRKCWGLKSKMTTLNTPRRKYRCKIQPLCH